MTGTIAMGSGDRKKGLRAFVWGAAACLLLVPAVAMLCFPHSGVDWTVSDFVVMGGMLSIACGLYEFGAWMSGNTAYRAGFGLAAFTAFLTLWVNLAVGMLGSEGSAINLMLACVPGIALVGGWVAAFKPKGMALAMTATAIVQCLVVGVGLAMREFAPLELALTAMFALPWLASAALFHNAARDAVRATASR